MTAQQWAYLLTYREFLDSGRVPTLEQCCTAARVHRTTVWRWYQTGAFIDTLDRIMAGHVDSRDRFVDFSVQRQAMEGRPKAVEANLRRRGLWDGGGGGYGGVHPLPSAHLGPQVHIHGIVAIPSRAEAQLQLPPPGSNIIMDCPPPPPELVAAIEEQKRLDLARK